MYRNGDGAMGIISLVNTLMQRMCVAIKHTVLDYAHPHPMSITIFPGGETSIDAEIVMATLEYTDLTNVTVLSEPRGEVDESRAVIWITDENERK